jgi:hypothetical protein
LVDYFLVGREGWSITEQEFIELVLSRWPSATINPVGLPGGTRSIDFRMQMPESVMEGHFNIKGSTVVFYGTIHDCAGFALWYQTALSEGGPFLLFDEGYNRSIELRPDTSVEDILGTFHDAPPAV